MRLEWSGVEISGDKFSWYRKETAVLLSIVEAGAEDSLDYYVDENRDYYVPKKSATDTITYLWSV